MAIQNSSQATGSNFPSPKLIQELKTLLRAEFDMDLSLEEVSEIGRAWVTLFTLLTESDPTQPTNLSAI